MAPSALYTLISLAAVVTAQQSTFPPTPLASKAFAYPSEIPDKVDTDEGLIRGTQFGYNKCNSTTEGPSSLCQTSFVNSVDDWCIWAPSEPNSVIANTEGEEVAWCTKPGRGTRLIPQSAIQGLQFMRTSDYIQVVGYIDQRQINIQDGDFGGELDPHGADLRGNPMGGLLYSNGWSNGQNDSFQQVREWHNFMGSGRFCIKACDPSKPNQAHFCEHVFDRIGMDYNCPTAVQNGTFTSCEGETQDFPGVYTENGQTLTYTQPPEEAGAIQTMPYTPRVPASSNCVTHSSAELFAAIATVTPTIGDFAPGGASASAAASIASSASAKASGGSSAGSTGSGAAGGLEGVRMAVILGAVSMLFGTIGSALVFA